MYPYNEGGSINRGSSRFDKEYNKGRPNKWEGSDKKQKYPKIAILPNKKLNSGAKVLVWKNKQGV